jgi:hypothetical protein
VNAFFYIFFVSDYNDIFPGTNVASTIKNHNCGRLFRLCCRELEDARSSAKAATAALKAEHERQLAAASNAAAAAASKAAAALEAASAAAEEAASTRAAASDAESRAADAEDDRDAMLRKLEVVTKELQHARQSEVALQEALDRERQRATAEVAVEASGFGSDVEERRNGAAAAVLAAATEEELAELRAENERLQAREASADMRVAAATAAQHARVAALEKQCRDLGWQVTMLTRGGPGAGVGSSNGGGISGTAGPPGSVAVPMPATTEPSGRGAMRAVGLLLRYRRQLAASYLVLLHALVYLAVFHTALFFSKESASGVEATA